MAHSELAGGWYSSLALGCQILSLDRQDFTAQELAGLDIGCGVSFMKFFQRTADSFERIVAIN